MYTLTLGGIVRRRDLKGHFYADYMQLYVSFDIKDNPSHQEEGVSKRSGWSGFGRTNNRAGNCFFVFNFYLIFFRPDQ